MIESTAILDAETVDAEAVFATIATQLSDLQWNPDMTGPPGFRRDETSPVVAQPG